MRTFLMKLEILSSKDWWALEKRLNVLIPEEEATKEFWKQVEENEAALRMFYSAYGAEEDGVWEVPKLWQRCRVLYSSIYADGIYTPALLPGVSAMIPKDGKSWYAQLECFSNAQRLPNGNPLFLGQVIVFEGRAYADADDGELVRYAARLE
jgi:hypothetical protein